MTRRSRRVWRVALLAVLLAAVLAGGCGGVGHAATQNGDTGRDAAGDPATPPVTAGVSLAVTDSFGQVLGDLVAFDNVGTWFTATEGGPVQFVYWEGCARSVWLMFPTSDCSGERALPLVRDGSGPGSAVGATAGYNPVAGTLCTPVAGETDEFAVESHLEASGGGPCGNLVCSRAGVPVTVQGSAWHCVPAAPPDDAVASGGVRVVVQRP